MKSHQLVAIALMVAGVLAYRAAVAIGDQGQQVSSEAVTTSAPKSQKYATLTKELGPKYKEGMSYMDFRAQLLADGWTPAGDPSGFLDSMLGSKYKDICSGAGSPDSSDANMCALSKKLPEIVICESSGGGGCLMSFRKDGAFIDVKTSGDITSLYDGSHRYGFYADSWHIYVTLDASPSQVDRQPVNRSVPKGFSSYAAESIANNSQCVVGAVVDEDGMNQRPFVYVVNPQTKQVTWSEMLNLPSNSYQSRATHCLEKGGSLYVLLQSDTQPEQTLSQTLLRVEKINATDGKLEASQDVLLTNISGAYSAWVDEGRQAFHADQDHIVVSGQYFRLADTNKQLSFQIKINDSLHN